MAATKEELQNRIDELEAENRELRQAIQELQAVARSSSEPGWLITTRNPNYAGTVYGVRFLNGAGFLPRARKDAQRTLQRIVSDFGYSVTEANAEQYEGIARGETPAPGFIDKVSVPGVL